ncbi:hypothetical protein [Neolewinella antarctica]|uniref:Lipoprotein n=1 Tax=Neolewinella antarctica TaxID=442734 RepID=A0ABX0X950_9BACT|nr:hypothetical protein [Neolewinella antarctica]NJC25513.1 hypothetical protein [Neolewinella antarctica]
MRPLQLTLFVLLVGFVSGCAVEENTLPGEPGEFTVIGETIPRDASECGRRTIIGARGTWEDRVAITDFTINEIIDRSCLDISYGGFGCSSEEILAFMVSNGWRGGDNSLLVVEATLRTKQLSSQPTCETYLERRDTFDMNQLIGRENTQLTIGDTTVIIKQ